MFKKTLLASTAALSLVLTACNDPKEANKENFGKSISEYLDTQPAVCITYPKSSFKLPIESSLNNEEQVVYPISGQFKSLYEDSVKQATYLAEKGLFTEETQSISVKDILDELLSDMTKTKEFKDECGNSTSKKYIDLFSEEVKERRYEFEEKYISLAKLGNLYDSINYYNKF